jgi:hypothetical protein
VAGDPLPKPTPEMERVSAVLAERLSRLRRHLIDGRLIARGTFYRTGSVCEIDPQQWARRGLYIDVSNGDLVEPENGELIARWTALTLWSPETNHAPHQQFAQATPFHVKPMAHDDLLSTAMAAKQSADVGHPSPSKAVQAVLSKEKVLTGNPGKRALNMDEPQPEPAIPDCPPELGDVAKREWDRLVGELATLRIITNLDRAALAAYCNAYALWADSIGAIQKYTAPW